MATLSDPASPRPPRSALALAFAIGAATGGTTAYSAKPQEVRVEAPAPVVVNGWRCVQSGIIDPTTGIAPEWCTLIDEAAPDAGP